MKNYELEQQIAEKEREILTHKAYLSSKDYQTIREMQGGEPMSAETKAECAEARQRINELEEEVAQLREQLLVETSDPGQYDE